MWCRIICCLVLLQSCSTKSHILIRLIESRHLLLLTFRPLIYVWLVRCQWLIILLSTHNLLMLPAIWRVLLHLVLVSCIDISIWIHLHLLLHWLVHVIRLHHFLLVWLRLILNPLLPLLFILWCKWHTIFLHSLILHIWIILVKY